MANPEFPKPEASSTTRALGLFSLQAVLWGGSFTFIHVGLHAMGPGPLVLFRLLLGAGVLVVVARARSASLVSGIRMWGRMAVAAALGNVAPYLLLSYGEGHTSAGIAGVLIGATPLFTLALAATMIQSERLDGRHIVGFGTGFAGLVIVLAPWSGARGGAVSALLCLAAAASYAAGYVYVRRYLSDASASPLGLAASQVVAAAAIQTILTPFLGWGTVHLGLTGMGCVIALGVLPTAFGTIVYFGLIAEVGPSAAAAVDYVVPVAAVLLGVVFTGETVGWNLFLGAAAVLGGMAVAEDRLHLPGRRSSPAACTG